MIPKLTSPRCLSAAAESILLEVGDGPAIGALIYQILQEIHPQLSTLEIDEGFAELMGRTPEHTVAHLWCAVSSDGAKTYYPLKDSQDPYIRACIVFEIFQTAGSEEANHFRIIQSLRLTRRIAQETVINHIRELEEEGLVIDQVAGKFVLNATLHKSVYNKILEVISKQY